MHHVRGYYLAEPTFETRAIEGDLSLEAGPLDSLKLCVDDGSLPRAARPEHMTSPVLTSPEMESKSFLLTGCFFQKSDDLRGSLNAVGEREREIGEGEDEDARKMVWWLAVETMQGFRQLVGFAVVSSHWFCRFDGMVVTKHFSYVIYLF